MSSSASISAAKKRRANQLQPPQMMQQQQQQQRPVSASGQAPPPLANLTPAQRQQFLIQQQQRMMQQQQMSQANRNAQAQVQSQAPPQPSPKVNRTQQNQHQQPVGPSGSGTAEPVKLTWPAPPIYLMKQMDNILFQQSQSIDEIKNRLNCIETGSLVVADGSAQPEFSGIASIKPALMSDSEFVGGIVDNIMTNSNLSEIIEQIDAVQTENRELRELLYAQQKTINEMNIMLLKLFSQSQTAAATTIVPVFPNPAVSVNAKTNAAANTPIQAVEEIQHYVEDEFQDEDDVQEGELQEDELQEDELLQQPNVELEIVDKQ